MLHGFLERAVVLVVVACWRAARAGGVALAAWATALGRVLLAGAGRGRRSSGGTATPEREDRRHPPDRRPRCSRRTTDQRPAQEPTKAVNILLMGADNPQRLVKKPTVAELLGTASGTPAPTAATR
jgi:hypothetical protein